MKDIKWFERKWVVNLKIKKRLSISFLFIAVLTAVSGVAGIIYVLSVNTPHAQMVAVIIGAVCVLEILFAIILANINAFLILDPMGKNHRIIERFSVGNFSATNVFRPRDGVTLQYKDEIGSFSRSLGGLMKYLVNVDGCIKKISEGDLSVEVPHASPEDQIGNGMTQLVNNYNNLVDSMATAVNQVTSGADLVSNSSLALSQGATQQASTVQELTASLEQISTQTHLNAENAGQANELTKNAKTNAAKCNMQMKDMLNAMSDISNSSYNINNIIKVIDDIAFQTNILALNAAVEAARAGQHGKGFAVVAEEVKNLAGKSANAAKETTVMIENSIDKVEVGTKIADQTAGALDEIVSQVDLAAELINSIAAASVDQASGIEQINFGIAQVSEVVQTNAATAEENASASEELSSQAINLKEHIGTFKLKN